MMKRCQQIGNLFQPQLQQGFLMQPYFARFRRQSQPGYNPTRQQNSFQQVHNNQYKPVQKVSSSISWSVSKLSHSQQPSLIKSSSIQQINTYTNPDNNPNPQILFSQTQKIQNISQQYMQYHLIQRLSSICQHKMECVMVQFNNIRNQLVVAIQREREKSQYCRMGEFVYGSEGVQAINERLDKSVVNINYHKYGLKNQIQVLIAEILQHLGYIRPQLYKHHHSQHISQSNYTPFPKIYSNQEQITREYNHNRISQLIKQARNNYYSHVYNNQFESQESYHHFNLLGQGFKLQCQSYCGENCDFVGGNYRERLEDGGQGDEDGQFRYVGKIIEQNKKGDHKNRQIANMQAQQQKLSLTYSKFSNKSSINKLADQKQEIQSIHSNVFNYNNNNHSKEETCIFENMELHLSISETDINSNSESNDTILYDKTVVGAGHCRQLEVGDFREEYVVELKQKKLMFQNSQYLYGKARLNQISIRQNTPRNTYNYLKYRMKLKKNLQKQLNDVDKNRVGGNKNKVDKESRQNKMRIKDGQKGQNIKYQYLDQQITIFKPNACAYAHRHRHRHRNEADYKQKQSKNKQNPDIESISILNVRIDYRNQVNIKMSNQRQSRQQAKTKTKTKPRKLKCKQIYRGYPFCALIHHRVHN